jgi:hypothetical protein
MGLLSLGTPLAWEDAKKYSDHVREHGISQFLSIWENLKDRQGDELLWGDEVSCRGVPTIAARILMVSLLSIVMLHIQVD